MIPQRCALIFFPKRSPTLQFRDDPGYEIVEARRQKGEHDVETIASLDTHSSMASAMVTGVPTNERPA
jgi:hypothetical protein